jgi:hypothetical protein
MNIRASIVGLVCTLGVWRAVPVQGQSYAAALLPLPPGLRAGATVVRLDSASRPHVLRQGTNGMVCIDDRPKDNDFDVRCYRDTFIPVVIRAFQHGEDGAGPKTGAEIKAGTLKLPNEPTAGYRCLGPAAGYDAARNAIDSRIECWESLHFPFRTAADVGFPDEADVPESQQQRTPYVMASGRYWAHVMIRHSPPRP